MRTTRSAAGVGAALLGLAGCELRVIDHSERRDGVSEGAADAANGADAASPPDAASAPDSSPPSGGDCRTQPEGSACDDRDICTPRSVCRDGECFGENPFDSCIVADTVRDFSGTQGQEGWWYGFWNAAGDPDGSYDPETDFELMEHCDTNAWMPPGGCALESSGSEQEWTRNLSHGLQHAETRPYLELPVRRWVSDVSGRAHIFAEHYLDGEDASDGTRAMLLLDGVEIWRNEADRGMRAEITLEVELEVGTIVEQLLHPKEHQAADMTYFSITIGP